MDTQEGPETVVDLAPGVPHHSELVPSGASSRIGKGFGGWRRETTFAFAENLAVQTDICAIVR